jgi:hypothetical protein
VNRRFCFFCFLILFIRIAGCFHAKENSGREHHLLGRKASPMLSRLRLQVPWKVPQILEEGSGRARRRLFARAPSAALRALKSSPIQLKRTPRWPPNLAQIPTVESYGPMGLLLPCVTRFFSIASVLIERNSVLQMHVQGWGLRSDSWSSLYSLQRFQNQVHHHAEKSGRLS